jgi:hypothetical protein
MRQERFELPTFGSVDRHSIQLSYWRRGLSLVGAAKKGRRGRRGAGPDGSEEETRETGTNREPGPRFVHRANGGEGGKVLEISVAPDPKAP